MKPVKSQFGIVKVFQYLTANDKIGCISSVKVIHTADREQACRINACGSGVLPGKFDSLPGKVASANIEPLVEPTQNPVPFATANFMYIGRRSQFHKPGQRFCKIVHDVPD